MPLLIRGPTSHAAPSTYTLPQNQAFIPESVTATFDGSLAGGSFLPTLSIYAQSGELLARSPATEVAAGDSAEVTFAPLLRAAQGAAAASANLSYAVASGTGTLANGGAAFTLPDLTAFDTNDSAIFVHDTTGAAGHSGGIFIEGAGRFLALARAHYIVPGGGGPEPAASQMYAGWDSYNYNGSESDFAINHTIATGFPGFPQSPWGATLVWDAWNIDQQDIGAAFVGPPFSEYHVALYNNGTQTMHYDAAIMVLRIGDSDGL